MNALKYQRLKSGLKQCEAAMKIGIDPTRLSKLENGWLEAAPEELKKLAELYDVKESDLTKSVVFGR